MYLDQQTVLCFAHKSYRVRFEPFWVWIMITDFIFYMRLWDGPQRWLTEGEIYFRSYRLMNESVYMCLHPCVRENVKPVRMCRLVRMIISCNSIKSYSAFLSLYCFGCDLTRNVYWLGVASGWILRILTCNLIVIKCGGRVKLNVWVCFCLTKSCCAFLSLYCFGCDHSHCVKMRVLVRELLACAPAQ